MIKTAKHDVKKYPWGNWFTALRSGKVLCLGRGKDFHCLPHGMAQQFRNMSSKTTAREGTKPMRLSIQVDEKSLFITLLPKRKK